MEMTRKENIRQNNKWHIFSPTVSPTLQLEPSTYGTLVPLQPALHVAAVLVLESHSWTYKLHDSHTHTHTNLLVKMARVG